MSSSSVGEVAKVFTMKENLITHTNFVEVYIYSCYYNSDHQNLIHDSTKLVKYKYFPIWPSHPVNMYILLILQKIDS